MLETIRKYWIGLLVLILVGLHASIVGIIRHQASLAKIDASCEVDLGSYIAYQLEQKTPLQMRLHAIVPINHRMKSRQLIELNQAQIRQALEEYLRQLDSKLLIDPYLSDLKSNLMEVMIQTIGNSSIEDLVVTEMRQSLDAASLEFVSQGSANHRRKMVASLRAQPAENEEEEMISEEDLAEEDHEGDEHADPEADPNSHGTDDSGHGNEAKAHAKPAHGAADKSHGAASKSHGAANKPHGAADKSHGAASKSHGAAAKKPAGHGAKKPDAKAGHGGGHGADKKNPAKKGGH